MTLLDEVTKVLHTKIDNLTDVEKIMQYYGMNRQQAERQLGYDRLIVVAGRGSGKTTTLIDWVRQDTNNRKIVCISAAEKRRLQSLIAADVVLTFDEAKRTSGHSYSDKEIAIDNADIILGNMLRGQIKAMSVTGKIKQL